MDVTKDLLVDLLVDLATGTFRMQASTFKAPAVQQGKTAMLPSFGSVLGGSQRVAAANKRAAVRVQRHNALG